MITLFGQTIENTESIGIDSCYIPNFLEKLGIKYDDVLDEINQKISFIPRQSKEMLYRGKPLSREKFF